MKLKIPYKSFKNLEEIEFVSFILDCDKITVYRIDINRNNFPKFFDKKMECIEVDDSIYKKCDNVIFYPFLKNKVGWGKKVTFNPKTLEYLRINSSDEYVKNENVSGDVEMLKKWITAGTEISPVEKSLGKKNLIYFSAFGEEYVELLKLLIKGLKKQAYRNFDVLFITDLPTKRLIEKIKGISEFRREYLIVKKIKDPVEASMQKLNIYDYKNIKKYEKILFLDLDIMVIGDIGVVFDKKIYPNKIYSSNHCYDVDMHNMVYNTIQKYSVEQIARFRSSNIFPFNAGQFLFLNTPTMRLHFKNIRKFIKKWEGKYFFEQSFMNTYFNTLHMSDVFRFKDEFNFVLININDLNYKPTPDSVFVHFIGNIANAKDKMKFIKTNYKHLLPQK